MRLSRHPVQRKPLNVLRALAIFVFATAPGAWAEEETPTTALVISVAEQKLALLRDGGLIKKFPISTSKFGLGDSHGSYKTPLGKLRVCAKVGDHLNIGAVFKQRNATGEVLPINAPGRDPIVTRILWLDGLESQNANARSRGIYIHGTTEEKRIGEPVSYGCIRMRSKDVVEIYDEIPMEASVTIIEEKLPRFPKYSPPKPPIIAQAPPTKPEPAATPAPTALAKKTAPATPAPTLVAKASPGPNVTVTPAPKPEIPVNPAARLALQGSILDAGLPAGPKIPVLPTPPEPKDVPRLSTLTPGLPSGSAFSLQGISRDLSPVIRAADIDAATREAAAKAERDAAEATKPAPRIAFRAGQSEDKPKR